MHKGMTQGVDALVETIGQLSVAYRVAMATQVNIKAVLAMSAAAQHQIVRGLLQATEAEMEQLPPGSAARQERALALLDLRRALQLSTGQDPTQACS